MGVIFQTSMKLNALHSRAHPSRRSSATPDATGSCDRNPAGIEFKQEYPLVRVMIPRKKRFFGLKTTILSICWCGSLELEDRCRIRYERAFY